MQARRNAWSAFAITAVAAILVLAAAIPRALADDPEEITVALYTDYLPLSGLNLAGQPSGMMADVWRLWSEKTGVRVKFTINNFAQSVDAVRDGRADVHGGLFRNRERADWLTFSQTIHETTSGFYYWLDHGTAPTEKNLKGRAVGSVHGTYQADYLRRAYPDLRVRTFRDPMDMLRALARGEIAAAVNEDLAMDTLLTRAGVRGDVGRAPGELLRNSVHAGVPKGRADLKSLVDWGFHLISWAEFTEIEARWISDPADRFYSPAGTVVPFTQSEQEWLAENSLIKVGGIDNWPPIHYAGEDGKPEGMSAAIVKLLNERLNGRIHLTLQPWGKVIDDIKDGKLDATMDIRPLRSRETWASFTQRYLEVPHVFVTLKDAAGIKSFDELNGKTLALEKGFSTVEYVRKSFPGVKISERADSLAALKAVSSGEAVAYVGNRAVVKYLIGLHNNELGGLELGAQVPRRSSHSAIGVREDLPVLRDILAKVLHGLPTAKIRQIKEPWLGDSNSRGIDLTVREQQWLARNLDEKIRVMVGTWPPFHYVDDDREQGLALAYVRHVLGRLGLTWDPIRIHWHEAFAGIGKFEKVDLLPTIARSPERARLVAMTRDYLSFPMVIFSRKDAPILTGLTDLHGKTVAVEKNFIMHRRLKKDHPEIKILPVDETHHAIKAVSLGNADAYVGNLAAGGFHIERHGFQNVKVAAPTEYADDKQAIGVRRDWPELASMIDKVLASMTEQEHARLRNQALSVRFEHGLDIQRIINFAIPIAAVLLVIFIVFVRWNRRLAAEVGERRKAEEKLTEREAWFKSLLESAPDATVIVSPMGEIVRVNRQAEILFGVDRGKLLGEKIEVLVPDEIKPRHKAYRDGFVTASAPRAMGGNLKLKARKWDGKEFPVEISLSPIETAEGTLIAASVRDVTERRAAEAELAKKDAQLTAALENMSGGMFMVDKDLIIRVFNKKFIDLYSLPEVKVGMPLRDVMVIRAGRGEYGSGDPEKLVEERLQGYRDGSVTRTEDRAPGGKTLEVFRQPTEDGGVVCVLNDITVRKKAEEALAAQTKQLESLSAKLSRYLSPQIYEAIFAGASDASVQTERKKLTVFFSDIKNFTATTEEMEPEDMTYFLNDYLTKMTEIALEYGGTIDKYIGDAIMVFFGDPDTRGVREDALQAVKMAIAMQRRMVDLRAKWADMGFRFPFHIRCGVNTGYCNVGNFGSDQRIDYTIIGGQVNLAARLESICEPDGVTIAYETYTHVRDVIDAEPMEPIQVKGIKDPVKPFAVQGLFDNWEEDERYIRRDIRGMRLWIDLMRMSEEQRMASIKELEGALEVLKVKKAGDKDDAADD